MSALQQNLGQCIAQGLSPQGVNTALTTGLPSGLGTQSVAVNHIAAAHGHAAMLLAPGPFTLTPVSTLPRPHYDPQAGPVMTGEQVELLRIQISVYSTLCQQLVALYQTMTHQYIASPGLMTTYGGAYELPAPAGGALQLGKTAGRQRWTPSQAQLSILEKLFDQGNGTPNKQRLKEITAELAQHGPIQETNVYNWFQNRKARGKRKASNTNLTPAQSDDEAESPREKKPKIEKFEDCHSQDRVHTAAATPSVTESSG